MTIEIATSDNTTWCTFETNYRWDERDEVEGPVQSGPTLTVTSIGKSTVTLSPASWGVLKKLQHEVARMNAGLPKENARHQRRFEMESTHRLLTEAWTCRDGTVAKFAPVSPSTPREWFDELRRQGLQRPGNVCLQLRNRLKAERKARRK